MKMQLMKRMNSQRQVKAFTLIELLVVIAIISLLVSILLPSLSMAKDLARDALCKSNLRGIGLLACLYQEDNRGVFSTMSWDSYGLYGSNNYDACAKLCKVGDIKNAYGDYFHFNMRIGTNEGTWEYLNVFGCPGTEKKFGKGGYSVNAIATYYDVETVSNDRLWGSPAPGGNASAIQNPDQCFLYADVIPLGQVGPHGVPSAAEINSLLPDYYGFSDHHFDSFNVVAWDNSVQRYNRDQLYADYGYWEIIRRYGAGL